MSRITSGKIELRKERMRLGLAVSSAVEASRPLIDSLHHELTVDVHGRVAIVAHRRNALARAIDDHLLLRALRSRHFGEQTLPVAKIVWRRAAKGECVWRYR